jgi:hypothetical protein
MPRSTADQAAVTASDIRQIKLNYLQLNKRSGQPETNKPKRDAKEYESAEVKQTNLTTGRLNMKIGGQEHEVERPFT